MLKISFAMNRFLHFVLAFILMLIACSAHADTMTGVVVDAETQQPLEGVSIDIKYSVGSNGQSASTTIAGITTDSLGRFSVVIRSEARLLMEFRLIGYHPTRRVDYSSGSLATDTTDMGVIRLKPTALMMQEVVVSAKMPRFTMQGDTIVFHPEAFQLPEGASLADLIRKLPGVQQRDGGLYWNDKPLRMMMNGKDIFGSSGLVNQLPAEVAGKLKLYNRRSETARHTGKDDGEEDHVLDIQVKPGFLDRWYGNALAGGMTEKHYKANVNTNYLSDHDPWMVYAQANNENRFMERYATWSQLGRISDFGKSQYGSVSR